MGDQWDGWVEDGPDYGADLGGPAPDFADDGGYPVEGFGPADDGLSPDEGFGPAGDELIGGAAGAEDLGGGDPLTGSGPIGYGDEPFAPDPPVPAETGLGPADVPEPDGQVGFGAAGTPIGADPDLDPYGDSGAWPEPTFPDPLDLGPAPEPVDGFPWTDPATLGDAAEPLPDAGAAYAGAPEPAELAGYAAEEVPPGADPWTTLIASDDPATSTLARFWAPEGS
jgi:hypothetical protein